MRQVHFDYEFQLADDAKIRIPPKVEVDEKGRPIRTPVKKDPKDPDRNLWGVKGSASDLQYNQWAAVTFARTKEKDSRIVATLVMVAGDMPRK